MYRTLVVITLAAAITVACAQTPPKCTTPPQWNSGLFMLDFSTEIAYVANFSYDATNQRTRFIEDFNLLNRNMTGIEEEVINLYKEHTTYRIKFLNGTIQGCTKSQPTRGWAPIQVPADAEYVHTSCTGVIDDIGTCQGVQYDVWKGNVVVGNTAASYLSSFHRLKSTNQEDICIPLSHYLRIYKPTPVEYVHQTYYDIRLGVDPKVFTPPSECPK